jgi:hypothetical protein
MDPMAIIEPVGRILFSAPNHFSFTRKRAKAPGYTYGALTRTDTGMYAGVATCQTSA